MTYKPQIKVIALNIQETFLNFSINDHLVNKATIYIANINLYKKRELQTYELIIKVVI